MTSVDAVVIGGGQGGVPLALTLAGRGCRVLLFERGALGGTCVNSGCTPSKSFLAVAHAAGRARRAQAIGLRGEVHVDFSAATRHAAQVVATFRDGIGRKLMEAGVQVVHAEASFLAERVVRGGDVVATAPLIAIDTGGSAVMPRIAGLTEVPYLTNATFFAQSDLPRRLVVLGGGYIGLELGQGMARAGSEVHIVDSAGRLLGAEEPDVSTALAMALADDGVRMHLGVHVTRVGYVVDETIVALSDGSQIACDRVLVAVGRKPSTEALEAQRSGIELDSRGFVIVDDRLQTTCPGVYALGDVTGRPAFTHVAREDHRRVLDALDGIERSRDDRVLVYAIYTEPQVARVGLTLAQARERGYDARAVTMPLSEVSRAIEWGEQRGFYRMVVDEASDRILGATLVGYETAELIHVFVANIDAGATWQDLARAMHVHPTYAEALPDLARRFARSAFAVA